MGPTPDLGMLSRKLGAEDYNSSRYVSEIAVTSAGGEDILSHREAIHTLSDQTSAQLKQNVFRNYSQFIDTAKEISSLETDMLRLSHMICEQRKLLTCLVETSILGDTVPLTHNIEHLEEEEEDKHEEGNKETLEEVMEMVEGGGEILKDRKRKLVHHGDLVEIDVDSHAAIHRVHCYLTNDIMIVALWLPDRRGPIRYKLSCCYSLDKTPMVNVRDLSGLINSIKILGPQEPRLFQCKDEKSKKEWLTLYEAAKKGKRGADNGKLKDVSKKKPAPNEPDLVHDLNPFKESDDLNPFNENEVSKKEEIELPEWMAELSDSLDVCIAQREFESAVDLMKEAGNAVGDLPDAVAKDVEEVVKDKEDCLVEVLRNELKVTGDKSLQGGPSSVRRAVHLLSRLGRSTEAKELFLSHRTALNRHKIQQVRAECATKMYVQRLATTFFHQVSECVKEFEKCFVDQQRSLMLLWVEEETQWFYNAVERQIFAPPASLRTAGDCIKILNQQVDLHLEPDLDMHFTLETKLCSSLETLISHTVDRAIESAKLRHAENTFSLASPSSVSSLSSLITPPSSLSSLITPPSFSSSLSSLTQNTVKFSLSYLQLVDDLLAVLTQRLRHVVNEGLVSVLHTHLSLAAQDVRKDRRIHTQMVVQNASFLLDSLFSLVEDKYRRKTGTECGAKFAKLHATYVWMKDPSKVEEAKSKQDEYV